MAREMYKRRRYCRFSAEGIKEVDYKDVDLLKDFVSENAKTFGLVRFAFNNDTDTPTPPTHPSPPYKPTDAPDRSALTSSWPIRISKVPAYRCLRRGISGWLR